MIRSTLKGSFKGSPEITGPCGLEQAPDKEGAQTTGTQLHMPCPVVSLLIRNHTL